MSLKQFYRFYDTLVNDFYNIYGRNMNKSSMFLHGTFSKTVSMNRLLLNRYLESNTGGVQDTSSGV